MYNKRCSCTGLLLLLVMLLPFWAAAEPPRDGSEGQERKLNASPEPARPSPEPHPTPSSDSPASSDHSLIFSKRDVANFKIVAGVLYKLVKGTGGGNPIWIAFKLSAPEEIGPEWPKETRREAHAFVKEYERHLKEIEKDGFDEHADPKWVRDIEFSDGHPLKKDNGGR